jgi:hypothetical protein
MSQRFTGLYRGVWVLGLQVQNSHRSPFVAFRRLSLLHELPVNVFWTLGVDFSSLPPKRIKL